MRQLLLDKTQKPPAWTLYSKFFFPLLLFSFFLKIFLRCCCCLWVYLPGRLAIPSAWSYNTTCCNFKCVTNEHINWNLFSISPGSQWDWRCQLRNAERSHHSQALANNPMTHGAVLGSLDLKRCSPARVPFPVLIVKEIQGGQLLFPELSFPLLVSRVTFRLASSVTVRY